MQTLRIYSVTGRMGRRPYAVAIAGYLALMLALNLLTPYVAHQGWYGLAGLFVVASVAVATMSIRRLHDVGRAGYGIAWSFAPLVESAAMVGLTGGAHLQGRSHADTVIVSAVGLAFGIWGVIGTGWLLKTRGTIGPNAYGEDPGEAEAPDTLVAGTDALVLASGTITIRRGTDADVVATPGAPRMGGDPHP